MTATEQTVSAPDLAEQLPAHRVRRLSGAVALILAPWGFVITNACYAWMIRNGGSDATGAGALALAAGGPKILRLCLVAA